MYLCFNTSHVTLYHKSYLLALVFLRRFNTSHVTLYRCDRGFHFCTKASFQYISCYSLSSSGVTVTSSSTCFNTSHVTLYLEVHDKQKHCRSFNTSHVTLYRCPNRTHSGHYGRFNTSHVTLYPMERRIAETVNKFQYISCYSLSQSLQFLRLDPVVSIHLMLLFILDMTVLLFRSLFVSIHLMLLFIGFPVLPGYCLSSFQYISCYSLSFIASILSDNCTCFNTSHVTLYLAVRCSYNNVVYLFQYISCYSLSCYIRLSEFQICCFNTSHVTLYLKSLFLHCLLNNRFNTSHVTLYRSPPVAPGTFDEFQYISCYSLSPNVPTYLFAIVSFQYISCYSLSKIFLCGCLTRKRFNTSHVTLYPSFYRLFFF